MHGTVLEKTEVEEQMKVMLSTDNDITLHSEGEVRLQCVPRNPEAGALC